jgi:hypothetical protein
MNWPASFPLHLHTSSIVRHAFGIPQLQVGFTKQDTMLEVVADGTAPEVRPRCMIRISHFSHKHDGTATYAVSASACMANPIQLPTVPTTNLLRRQSTDNAALHLRLYALQSWSTVPKADLRLVCATGCAPVDSWATCNMARVPTAASEPASCECLLFYTYGQHDCSSGTAWLC